MKVFVLTLSHFLILWLDMADSRRTQGGGRYVTTSIGTPSSSATPFNTGHQLYTKFELFSAEFAVT